MQYRIDKDKVKAKWDKDKNMLEVNVRYLLLWLVNSYKKTSMGRISKYWEIKWLNYFLFLFLNQIRIY